MGFAKEDFIGDLYQTSIPKEPGREKEPLLSEREKNIEIYDFDEVKKWFCSEFRNKRELRSCDAYYEDARNNYLVIEFKNAHHLKMKTYMNEVEEKMTDTHMLLLETFWGGKSSTDIMKKVRAIVVYNDKKINYGEGVKTINNALNGMKPKNGKCSRKTESEVMVEEGDYQKMKEELVEKYKENFYLDVNFLDRDDFYELYIDAGYFKSLA